MERSIAPLPDFYPSILKNPQKSFLFESKGTWSLLIAGILYGRARYNVLYKQEKAKLEELERTREEREAKERLLREKRIQSELDDLAAQLGVKF